MWGQYLLHSTATTCCAGGVLIIGFLCFTLRHPTLEVCGYLGATYCANTRANVRSGSQLDPVRIAVLSFIVYKVCLAEKIKIYIALPHCTFSQRLCWRVKSSGILFRDEWWRFTDISKDCNASIFKDMQIEQSWRHYDPLKRSRLLYQSTRRYNKYFVSSIILQLFKETDR